MGFSPYYNRSSSPELKRRGHDEIRVLISTDVLSEGLNLQDATRLINYDIHWNPVRLMQRIGRVDRRMNPDIEARLLSDHPELSEKRGKVIFWNFLPPAELNDILSLYGTVTGKVLMISTTLGIEGKKLLTPDDDYQALLEFTHQYEGTRTAVEDLHLEYQSLIKDDLGLEERLGGLPGGLFSGRQRDGAGIEGVFLCYRLPALDATTEEFSEGAGFSKWYYIDLASKSISEDPGQIAASIRSKPATPRVCTMDQSVLLGIRADVRKHIKNTYLRRVDAPIGVEPRLVAWMEVTGA